MARGKRTPFFDFCLLRHFCFSCSVKQQAKQKILPSVFPKFRILFSQYLNFYQPIPFPKQGATRSFVIQPAAAVFNRPAVTA